MEGNETGRNQEISRIDGKNWNWREPRNHKYRQNGIELEGAWISQYMVERNGTERNLDILKIDGKKWNWKEPAKMKNTSCTKKEK